MCVKTIKRMKSLVVLTAALFYGFVLVVSQVKVFGVGQGSSYGEAKPILVDIQNRGTDFNMNILQDSALVLEASDKTRYQSSPIIIDGDRGYCEFPQLIPPERYTLIIMRTFGPQDDIIIPPTPYPAVSLHVTILPGRISVFADVILRNEIAYEPETTPIPHPPDPSMILSRVELEYPPDAEELKITGIMRVEVVVNEKGEVYEAKMLMGHPLFKQAALNAVLKWKFQPMIVNGVPKPFVTTVTLDFHF